MKLVTEWATYKQRFQAYQDTKAYSMALHEVNRIRTWLRALPMSDLNVGDYQLINAWLIEVDRHEARIKAFVTYEKVFPEG